MESKLTLTSTNTYAAQATTYLSEPDDYVEGVQPLDSLPAGWWNWLWKQTTDKLNNILSDLTDTHTELNNILNLTHIDASADDTSQLSESLLRLHQSVAGAASYSNPIDGAGSVVSSDISGKVSVDVDTGIMTPNGMGNPENIVIFNDNANTSEEKETIVAALNSLNNALGELSVNLNNTISEVQSTLQTNIDNEAATREANDNTLQSNLNTVQSTLQTNIDAESSTREANDNTLQSNLTSHATEVYNGSNKSSSNIAASHVTLSDNYTSSAGAASAGVGASSQAVYNTYNTCYSKIRTSAPSSPANGDIWVV